MLRDDDDLDLGEGHVLSPVHDQNDRLVGWLHTHRDVRSVDSRVCQSFCAVVTGLGPDVHVVDSLKPLTLSPSLKCRVCGSHGHVENGQWRNV
jgi:hypothetical protein